MSEKKIDDKQYVEVLGETCIDGGTCHHACTTRCFRRECCTHFSSYSGPWAYPKPAAEQSAPGEVEEVERIGYAWVNRYNDAVDHVAPFPPTEGGVSYGEPLMAIDQHNRIVAQLAARDAGEVRVPVELAERILKRPFDAEECLTLDRQDALEELRALLVQRERGEQS